MSYKLLPLGSLSVNRANDRHGELENETSAIAWLFHNREQHMLNLAKDIVDKGGIYEPPLVWPDGSTYTVFDGNRRVTCLKLLENPKRAPNAELQQQFAALKAKWPGPFPDKIQCQVETDRDRIDEILFRRHTGSQSGVGQSTWDDRMKSNFVNRTGKGGAFNAADEIEKRLIAAALQPKRQIPRSTLNRLLSSEAFRNRLGFSVVKGRFEFTHDHDVSLRALQRVANDLAHKHIVLGDIWDVDGKREYLDDLEKEGVLPTAAHTLAKSKPGTPGKPGTPPSPPPPKPSPPAKPTRRTTLIPQANFPLPWPGRLSEPEGPDAGADLFDLSGRVGPGVIGIRLEGRRRLVGQAQGHGHPFQHPRRIEILGRTYMERKARPAVLTPRSQLMHKSLDFPSERSVSETRQRPVCPGSPR